jgi:hypothetical protein
VTFGRAYRFVLILAALVMAGLPVGLFADNCFDCHSSWEEDPNAPSKTFPQDIHYRSGLGCSDCHGGDSTLDDMDEVRASESFRGVPTPLEIPDFCARCHSDPKYMIKHNPGLPVDQLEKYKTSIHGQRLFGKHDPKVATCVSCHTAHRIETAKAPISTVYAENIPATCAKCHANADYMKEYGIPTNQYADYVKSVHGVALLVNKDNGAPACNGCHGNHAATPPGVTSLAAVCGICHALISENFAGSPHKAAFDDMGLPECETCHSNHLIVPPHLSWIGTGDSSLCLQCHSEDDGTTGYEVASKIHNMLFKIDSAYTAATTLTDDADTKGMMVVDERLALKEVKQATIQAATEMHTLDVVKVDSVTSAGLKKAAEVDSADVAKIDNYYFRRKGLGIATLLITILAIALYFKIRSLGK